MHPKHSTPATAALKRRIIARRDLRLLPLLRAFLALSLAFSLFSVQWDLPAFATPVPTADIKPKVDPALKGLPISELSTDEAVLHALNRLAYGPRPGDLHLVKQ